MAAHTFWVVFCSSLMGKRNQCNSWKRRCCYSSSLFDRSLVEAVQGIALSSGNYVCRLPKFCVFCHVLTYLRIVSIHITLILNKIRHVWELYQIASKALWHVWTCLRIISNRIISIMTCLDMFVESYQIVSGYFQRILKIMGVLIALKA